MSSLDDESRNSDGELVDASNDNPLADGDFVDINLPPQRSTGPTTSHCDNDFTHILTLLMICM